MQSPVVLLNQLVPLLPTKLTLCSIQIPMLLGNYCLELINVLAGPELAHVGMHLMQLNTALLFKQLKSLALVKVCPLEALES